MVEGLSRFGKQWAAHKIVKSSKIVPPQLYMLSITTKACHGIGFIAASPPTILVWWLLKGGYRHVLFRIFVFAVVVMIVGVPVVSVVGMVVIFEPVVVKLEEGDVTVGLFWSSLDSNITKDARVLIVAAIQTAKNKPQPYASVFILEVEQST